MKARGRRQHGRRIALPAWVLSSLLGFASGDPATAQPYSRLASVVAGGGGRIAGGALMVTGTAGQAGVGVQRAGFGALASGFWACQPGSLAADAVPSPGLLWTNLNGGRWSVAANWSPNRVPGLGDSAFITQAGTYTVLVDTILGSGVRMLSLGGAGGAQSLLCRAALAMPIQVQPSGVIRVDGGSLHGPVTNAGSIQLLSAGYGLAAPAVENRSGAAIDIVGNGSVNGGTLRNWGTVRKSGGDGISSLIGADLKFENAGMLEVQTGTLEFLSIARLTSAGIVRIAPGATLRLASGDYAFDPANRFVGEGLCVLKGAALIQGVLDGTPGFRVDGDVEFDARLEAGTMTWNYSAAVQKGNLTIGPGATFQIGSTFTLSGAITNFGRIVWGPGGGRSWNWLDGARLENETNGVFDLQIDGDFSSATGRQRIRNAGVFEKSGGSGIAHFRDRFVFENSGSVAILGGALSFASELRQRAGELRLAGGQLEVRSGLQLDGGWLSGAGVITGSVANAGGRVHPSTPGGTIHVTGGFRQDPGGELEFDLDGAAMDRPASLIVAGAAGLDGGLNVHLASGVLPAPGKRLPLIVFHDRSGTFASVQLPENCRRAEAMIHSGLAKSPGMKSSVRTANVRWQRWVGIQASHEK